jgi:Zn-dependent M32 family carboxypeptidase
MAVVNIERLTNSLNEVFNKYIKVINDYKNENLVAKDQIKTWFSHVNKESVKIIKNIASKKTGHQSVPTQSSSFKINNMNNELMENLI